MCIFNRMENRMIINRQEEISRLSFYFGCNKLNRLFITHLHGDHIFGLPSVILGISFEKDRKESQSTPIFLYGPAGIAEYLSTAFRVCNSKITCSLKICELCLPNQPCSSMKFSVFLLIHIAILPSDINYNRLSVQPIYPDGNGVWTCFDEEFGAVKASTISHNITTFGYSYKEKDQPGNLHADRVIPLLRQNEVALRQQQGLGIYDVVKRFKV